MPAFNTNQLKHFNAVSGACSPVTDREATGDKSVTIDKHEKSVLKTCYSLNSFTRAGGALPDGKPSHFNFNVISFKNNKLSYEQHELAIKYPKSNKDELRLYFNRESTFYPPTDSTWFIFTKQGDPTPYIGFMKTSEWGNIGVDKTTKEVYEHDYLFDGDDDNYQKSIAEPIEDTDDELADIADEEPKLATSKQRGSVSRHHRKAKLAKKAFRAADYKCQFNKDHRTFISGATKKPYIEAHHLVPVSLNGTDEFEYELDVVENIIPLCPMCHRAIHFGDTGTKKELLQKFIKELQDKLKKKKINITFERLLQIYGAD